MITDIEDYFSLGCGRCKRFATADCSTRQWAPGLLDLRQICQETGLLESVKWGHPCYVQGDRNIAILGALRSQFQISFFNASLMKDPARVLEKQGTNAQSADTIRFTDNAQVLQMRPIIIAYLNEAIEYALAGVKPLKAPVKIELPDELVVALECDAELAAAFGRLTSGRQKSYVINLNSAKKSETRIARIAKFREKILNGKGALER